MSGLTRREVLGGIAATGATAAGLTPAFGATNGEYFVEGQTPTVELAAANQGLRQATNEIFKLPNDQIQGALEEFSADDRGAIRTRLETQILDSRGYIGNVVDLTQRIIDNPGSVGSDAMERLTSGNPSLIEFFEDLQGKLADDDPANDPTRDEIREGYQEWRSDYLDQVDQAINTLGMRAEAPALKAPGIDNSQTFG